MGLCLIFSGLFSFSGCSLVKEDQSKINNGVVMKIGNTELTKNDVINAFYTYYQNNSSYFSYYDNEVIEQSFYTWLTVKTLVEDMSIDVLYNAETNPNGMREMDIDGANGYTASKYKVYTYDPGQSISIKQTVTFKK